MGSTVGSVDALGDSVLESYELRLEPIRWDGSDATCRWFGELIQLVLNDWAVDVVGSEACSCQQSRFRWRLLVRLLLIEELPILLVMN